MADPKVVNEEVVFYDADGNVVEDKDKAASAEVTQTMSDGSKRHTLMKASPSSGPSSS
jgi:hypothetical protein